MTAAAAAAAAAAATAARAVVLDHNRDVLVIIALVGLLVILVLVVSKPLGTDSGFINLPTLLQGSLLGSAHHAVEPNRAWHDSGLGISGDG